MLAMALVGSSMGLLVAQDQNPSLPKTPTAFETRNTGGTTDNEVSIEKRENKPIKITFIAVTDSREWRDATGKVIRARLLAFDAPKGDEANLVREGKIRLLVDGAKAFSLFPLDKLCHEDRAFIGSLVAARKPQESPGKTAE